LDINCQTGEETEAVPPSSRAAQDRVVLAVDGNSLVHRSYHSQAGTGLHGAGGDPIWAVRGLLTQLVAAVDRFQPDVVVVGFDDPDLSWRREKWPQYKANRSDKLPTLVRQLEVAAEVLRNLGVGVIVPAGLEADDVLASTARAVATAGGTTVIVTSDRDAFALIDAGTHVLRIINGGVECSPLITAERLVLLLGVRPDQYPDFAALRGDPSDNLPGVRGIGAKTAARILAELGSAATAFAGPEEVARSVGSSVAQRLQAPDARATWELNRQVMAMRDDVPIDVSTLPTLPLPPASVRATFDAMHLRWTTADALRVLCGEPGFVTDERRQAWDHVPPDVVSWAPRPGPIVRRKVREAVAADQLALFD
jgi:5'-3' exonuclease